MRRRWELGLFSLEKRRSKWCLTNVYKHLKQVCKEDRARTSQWCPVTQPEGRAQTETQAIPPEYQEMLFHC